MTDEELRALAQAATPGPWKPDERYVVGGDGKRGFRPGGEVIICAEPTISHFQEYPKNERIANARYIAAANPATVLALLDRLARADAIEAAARKELERHRPNGKIIRDACEACDRMWPCSTSVALRAVLEVPTKEGTP